MNHAAAHCTRCEQLEQQLRRIRRAVAPRLLFPEEWELNRGETSILASLYSSPDGFRSVAMLKACAAIFGREAASDDSIVYVRMRSLRIKLPAGIRIITRHAEGYYLPSESKALLKAALDAEQVDGLAGVK